MQEDQRKEIERSLLMHTKVQRVTQLYTTGFLLCCRLHLVQNSPCELVRAGLTSHIACSYLSENLISIACFGRRSFRLTLVR
jgi:hypothetical protein